MPTERYKPEQIMTLLRQVEVVIANGKLTPQACQEAGISEQTFYRWRKEYGGLKLDQPKRLKALEQENAKLKRLVVPSQNLIGPIALTGRCSLRLSILIVPKHNRELFSKFELVSQETKVR